MVNNKNYFITLIAVVLFIMIAVNLYAQVDPNEKKSDIAYPTRFIPILAVATEPYGVDVVVPYGTFDVYQVSQSAGFCETSVAVNPRNSMNAVGTDNRVTGFAGGKYIFYTTNGGVNWNQTLNYLTNNQGDDVLAADSLGNFYLAVLNNGMLVFKSTDMGVTWNSLGNINSNNSADKEWIACDQTSGPYRTYVYTAYVNFATYSVDFWRSTNSGASWTGPLPMGWGTPNPGPNIATGPNGEVYVAFYNGGGSTVRKSTDGGASFAAGVVASVHSNPGSINASGRYVLKTDVRVSGWGMLAVDMTNGPYRGYVYHIYPCNPPGPDQADIYMTRSTDGGQTWNSASPLRVNDDNTFCDQFMPYVSVDTAGRVWCYWWDSRTDTTNNNFVETWGTVSTDGGASFARNFMISNQNFNPAVIKIYQGPSHYYLGDYQMIASRGITFPFYCCQGNNLNDYTAYLPDFGLTFSKFVDSVTQGATSVNKVYIPLHGPYAGTITYTASVSPPAQGTITFNWSPSNVKTINGNPDSLTLNTVVSSTVPNATYFISVTGTEASGIRSHNRTWQLMVSNLFGIQKNQNSIPTVYNLDQNFPNPFNPTTIIYYALPKQSLVNLKVYDVLGREVSSLINNETKPAGNYDITFNAQNLSSGIYYYRLTAGDFTDVKKMVLVK